MAQLISGSDVRIVQGATAGSFLRGSSARDGDSYWVDQRTGQDRFGPAGIFFEAAIREELRQGREICAFVGAGHESEAGKLNSSVDQLRYELAQAWVFEKARSIVAEAGLQPPPVFISPIGRRGEPDYRFSDGVQSIRRIQNKLVATRDWLHLLPETYDIPTDGGAHLRTKEEPNGYVLAAPRQTRKIAQTLGAPIHGGVDGPRIVRVRRRADQVTVSIELDGGTTLRAAGAIDGFRYRIAGTDIPISDVQLTGPTEVRFKLPRSRPRGTEMLFYGYGALTGTEPGRILRDDQDVALPLRWFEGSPTIE
ncbi:hypothetical protein SAMN05192530_1248 [Aureimonas jatrophae]|uniref:Sialate O-acetylesterase domain-containing protein n=2 Tax=Aureimonas jatrophae TaxID=1166073 RepID=A0A1H0NM20_9HYPH|nr:hypothetical protein SAMN05192530_1248 [Aureimonas jatrophae]